ncbi:hypothetical protein MRX96_016609 [Rhipicephalus microplus]
MKGEEHLSPEGLRCVKYIHTSSVLNGARKTAGLHGFAISSTAPVRCETVAAKGGRASLGCRPYTRRAAVKAGTELRSRLGHIRHRSGLGRNGPGAAKRGSEEKEEMQYKTQTGTWASGWVAVYGPSPGSVLQSFEYSRFLRYTGVPRSVK